MGGLPAYAAARAIAERGRQSESTARIITQVIENLRTHRFRRGRCYDIGDEDAQRIATLACAAAPGRFTADNAGAVLEIIEREIAPFAVTIPGQVGRR